MPLAYSNSLKYFFDILLSFVEPDDSQGSSQPHQFISNTFFFRNNVKEDAVCIFIVIRGDEVLILNDTGFCELEFFLDVNYNVYSLFRWIVRVLGKRLVDIFC